MYIHDELLHDTPERHNERFPYDIKRLMEQSGDDIGLKLPVEMSRIRISWDQDEEIKPLIVKRKGPIQKIVAQ
jgi:DNA polymerase I-like protein with 3'-5' exonuclease and polymerase domains